MFRAVPNEGPKLLAERVCIHMMHEKDMFYVFAVCYTASSRNAREATFLVRTAVLSACAMRFFMSSGANFTTCGVCEGP